MIFTAVSINGDHGYVFVQDQTGPCIGCLFPDMANDDRYPCPGTPAIADILQAVGSLAVYATDTLLESGAVMELPAYQPGRRNARWRSSGSNSPGLPDMVPHGADEY